HVVAHNSLGTDGLPDGKLIAIVARGSESEAALAELKKTQCLGLMAAEFAHELNNTLTSICGWLQIMAQDLPAGPGRESLDIVHGEARRTARMAASLLTMARGKADAPHTMIDLNALLDAVLTLIEPAMKRKGIELSRRFCELPHVCGSEDQLRQVFVNLLFNARNAIGEDGRIMIATRAAGDGEVSVSVSDNGCGISRDDIDRIFEAFYTSRAEDDGTGLGLYVCRRIVRRHNGNLLVESIPGDGSTFTVVLPAATETEVRRTAGVGEE
ncbi:MAG: HAMP domain-containing histidine kinase, partial [Planctomycetes bacterium]|nr:HAMP domain-containing histidine kinase [Planctomycetota bacterium]